MYLVIYYSTHEKQIASVDKKDSYEDALDFLIKDVENTYNEEIANSLRKNRRIVSHWFRLLSHTITAKSKSSLVSVKVKTIMTNVMP